MGKAQSKRSVDITTETKKGTEDEVTEKMGKIEDLDKKEVVNGDATLSEKSDHEKKDVEDVENDKDMTTEKDVDVQASGDSADPHNTAEASKEEGGSATAEEISPLADESIKKSKKEKVKKKWSFRSISFGKKDKQKPAKSEEAAEDGSAAVNGNENEEKTNESDDTQKDKSANENEEKTTETHENGNATTQELNGEQNGEKPNDDKSKDITANTTNNSTTEKSVPVQNETAAVTSELSEKTENTAVNNETKTSENATVDDASKNGNGEEEKRNTLDQELKKTDDTNASAEASSEKTSPLANAATTESTATTNGEVVDEIHQNGDHGEPEQAVIEKSKAQIEVNSNTDKNVSAATLDSLSSTSTNPSHVQTHVQDLKASSEEHAEMFPINCEAHVIEKTDNTDVNNIQIVDQIFPNEITGVVEMDENATEVKEVFDSSSKTSESEKPILDNLGAADSSPPPLPISPPPSQVSVFAFTNSEDSIQTKSFESEINNLIEEKTEIPLSSSELPPAEIEYKPEIGSVPTDNETFVEKTASQEQLPDVEVDTEYHQNRVEEDASVCKDFETENTLPSVIPEESLTDEEASVAFAATMISEITKTAAEIVNQQLKSDDEQITDGTSSNNFENISQDGIKEGNSNEHCNDDNKQKNEEVEELLCEDDNENSEELALIIEQTSNKTIESSLDFTESNLMHQNEEEMNSLNKSNNFDEMHLDPTKEFATAKDIKDNVTVAEITQDLSVTCE